MSSEPGPWLPAAVNQGWTYRDRVGPAEAGLSAVAFYAARYRHSDAATWRLRLAAGEIRRGGELLGADDRLAGGDRLSWQRPPWWEEAVPDLGPCLHDDGDLCVLDKPSGLPVLPAGGWLEHTVLRRLERRHRGDPAGIPRPVHRLGRFTSGLLVCARRPATRAWLSAALRESTALAEDMPLGEGMPLREGSRLVEGTGTDPAGGGSSVGDGRPLWAWPGPDPAPHSGPRAGDCAFRQIGGAGGAEGATVGLGGGAPQGVADRCGPSLRKLYRALLVPGALALAPGDSLLIRTPIGRRPHPRLGRLWCAASDPQPGDLPAHSCLTLLERSPEADLVMVAIGSGRPHQIRIHCAAVGAPLLGDPLYRAGGGADPQALPGEGGYRLQAWRLELRRPEGSRLVLEAPRALGA